MNSTYYITQILQPLHQAFFPQGGNRYGERLVVQVENRSVHKNVTIESFMKTRDMISMSHIPYSPDLALGDFYSVPSVKERLEHACITDEDQSFQEPHTILRSIPGEELGRVFEAS
jgi:hypothetical protein